VIPMTRPIQRAAILLAATVLAGGCYDEAMPRDEYAPMYEPVPPPPARVYEQSPPRPDRVVRFEGPEYVEPEVAQGAAEGPQDWAAGDPEPAVGYIDPAPPPVIIRESPPPVIVHEHYVTENNVTVARPPRHYRPYGGHGDYDRRQHDHDRHDHDRDRGRHREKDRGHSRDRDRTRDAPKPPRGDDDKRGDKKVERTKPAAPQPPKTDRPRRDDAKDKESARKSRSDESEDRDRDRAWSRGGKPTPGDRQQQAEGRDGSDGKSSEKGGRERRR